MASSSTRSNSVHVDCRYNRPSIHGGFIVNALTAVYTINTILNVAMFVDLVAIRSMNVLKPKPWHWMLLTLYGGLALLDAELYVKVSNHTWSLVCAVAGLLLMTSALLSYNKSHKKDNQNRFFDRNDIWPV